jgi:hypothetical protein
MSESLPEIDKDKDSPSRVHNIQEVYSSAIDGVPNTDKDEDVEGYAFGKQPVQPIEEEPEAVYDDAKAKPKKKNETPAKD